MNPLAPSAETILSEAIAIPKTADRDAYLDRVCGGDTALRERLGRLVVNHFRAGDFLEASPVGAVPTSTETNRPPVPGPTVGTQIGPYILSESLGEGGMGLVFVADQTEPIRRQVALKVIKPGLDSRQVLARFEAERQALALMDHPNVTKVLDAGATDSGAPYFVMELVKGVPVTEYCDANKLDIPERLSLFVQICSAVQHAHQKGIIHRDLTPSNILVESHDGRPVPRVIDFGLAKAITGLQLSEHSVFTGFGSVMGTPQYMAPEQAGPNAADVDTRADVFALGVILYELLTGTTPLSRDKLKNVALDEMLKLIREQETPNPSSRLSSPDSQSSVATNRQSEPGKLNRFVKGELDWIVLKALSKERERRYDSASSFAQDIERFLNHEPVLAGPITTAYRVRKFVRRNRGQVIAAGLILVALLAGITGTTVGLFEARKQQRIAQRESELKEEARLAEAERAEGERNARQLAGIEKANAINQKNEAIRQQKAATAAKEFLRSVLDQAAAHGQASLERVANPKLTMREALDFASRRIVGAFPDQPEIEADLRNTIGLAYLRLASISEAEHHSRAALDLFEKALGPDDTDTLLSANNLGMVYLEKKEYEAAERFINRALVGFEKKLGSEDANTLNCVNSLAMLHQKKRDYATAERLHKRALAGREKLFGPDDMVTLTSVNNLAMLYLDKKDYVAAEGLLLRAIAGYEKRGSPNHPDTLTCVNNLGGMYLDKKDYAAGGPLLRRAVTGREKILGPDHVDTLASVFSLARLRKEQGDIQAAERLQKRALDGYEKVLGPDDAKTLRSLNALGRIYLDKKDAKNAELLLKRALAGWEKVLGPDDWHTVDCVTDLAKLYKATGEFEASESLYKRAIIGYEKDPGPNHINTLRLKQNLGAMYWKMKRFDDSIKLLEDVSKQMRATLGDERLDTLLVIGNLGMSYRDAGRVDEAIVQLEEAYRFAGKYPALAGLGNELITAYSMKGNKAEATRIVLKQLNLFRQRSKPESAEFARELASSGKTLLDLGSFADAEPLLRESLTLREKLAPNSWTTANSKSLLGEALLGQKKYADAEPLLLAGFERLRDTAGTIPPEGQVNLPEAVERLMRLYTATHKPDEVKKYRDLRAKYPREAAPTPREKM